MGYFLSILFQGDKVEINLKVFEELILKAKLVIQQSLLMKIHSKNNRKKTRYRMSKEKEFLELLNNLARYY